ncbi:unnamed protein product [Amoebophrya sp. A25]|nr:unnamed protein product [Amoebophrya sp. A25]|eukprot:GSA25T00000556001.1
MAMFEIVDAQGSSFIGYGQKECRATRDISEGEIIFREAPLMRYYNYAGGRGATATTATGKKLSDAVNGSSFVNSQGEQTHGRFPDSATSGVDEFFEEDATVRLLDAEFRKGLEGYHPPIAIANGGQYSDLAIEHPSSCTTAATSEVVDTATEDHENTSTTGDGSEIDEHMNARDMIRNKNVGQLTRLEIPLFSNFLLHKKRSGAAGSGKDGDDYMQRVRWQTLMKIVGKNKQWLSKFVTQKTFIKREQDRELLLQILTQFFDICSGCSEEDGAGSSTRGTKNDMTSKREEEQMRSILGLTSDTNLFDVASFGLARSKFGFSSGDTRLKVKPSAFLSCFTSFAFSLWRIWKNNALPTPTRHLLEKGCRSADDDILEKQQVSCLCPTIARFNHGCMPNAMFDWRFKEGVREEQTRGHDIFAPALGEEVVVATVPIRRGEEILVNYIGPDPWAMRLAERQEIFARDFGFHCRCYLCSCEDLLVDEQVESSPAESPPRPKKRNSRTTLAQDEPVTEQKRHTSSTSTTNDCEQDDDTPNVEALRTSDANRAKLKSFGDVFKAGFLDELLEPDGAIKLCEDLLELYQAEYQSAHPGYTSQVLQTCLFYTIKKAEEDQRRLDIQARVLQRSMSKNQNIETVDPVTTRTTSSSTGSPATTTPEPPAPEPPAANDDKEALQMDPKLAQQARVFEQKRVIQQKLQLIMYQKAFRMAKSSVRLCQIAYGSHDPHTKLVIDIRDLIKKHLVGISKTVLEAAGSNSSDKGAISRSAKQEAGTGTGHSSCTNAKSNIQPALVRLCLSDQIKTRTQQEISAKFD